MIHSHKKLFLVSFHLCFLRKCSGCEAIWSQPRFRFGIADYSTSESWPRSQFLCIIMLPFLHHLNFYVFQNFSVWTEIRAYGFKNKATGKTVSIIFRPGPTPNIFNACLPAHAFTVSVSYCLQGVFDYCYFVLPIIIETLEDNKNKTIIIKSGQPWPFI